MMNKKSKLSENDLYLSFKSFSLIMLLGGKDIRQRYKRSAIGPFWITISMAVMIATMGIVFANLFKTNVKEFLPYLTLGIITWSYIMGSITEGCDALISSEGIIKQLPIPLCVHIIKVLWKNFIVFLHNIIIFPFVLIFLKVPINWSILLVLPGLLLLAINLVWILVLISLVCARFRDMGQIIASLMQVIFYLTPVIWMPKLLTHHIGIQLLQFNPFYHFINIVRSPLLGVVPDVNSYIVTSLMAIIGISISAMVISKFKYKIPYWV